MPRRLISPLAPMKMLLPSPYWPIAALGFSKSRSIRRIFRLVFTKFYRKRIWNPLINSWGKSKGFDRPRFALQNNVHALWSGMWLYCVAVGLWHSPGKFTFILLVADLLINMPAIVLSRYLYLITMKRC